MSEEKSVEGRIEELVLGMVGYSDTIAAEAELQSLCDRDVEDVALDYDVERCTECGVWQESNQIREDIVEEGGDVVCHSCRPA